jgi:hypothetical protein
MKLWRVASFVGLAILGGAVGCGGVPVLPQMLDVSTSASAKIPAERGTGPAALADSMWSLVRVADPGDPAEADTGGESAARGPYGGILTGAGLERPPVGERIFLVEFGAGGVMTRVTENRFFLPRIYGSTVPVGGDWHGTTLPGISFASASYGVQDEDVFGSAVVVNVRLGNLFLGRAILYSWGTVAGHRIEGQFGYLLDFTEGMVSQLGTIADQYPVVGERIE